jgi:hypothetical protein
MNDPDLTDLEDLRRALAGRVAEPHPEEESWERFALEQLSEPERLALIDHALQCGRCARILRVIGAIERPAAAGPLELTHRRQRASPWRWLRPGRPRLATAAMAATAAIAAILLVATAVPWLVARLAMHRVDAEMRGDRVGERSVEILAPTGVSTHERLAFRWSAMPNAETYRVHLFREDGVPVATSEPIAALELSAERFLAELPAGRYVVRVEALRDGAPVGSSPLSAF